MSGFLGGLWRGVRWLGRGLGHALGERPKGDWLLRLAQLPGVTPGEVAELERLHLLYQQSFCGQCAASPDYPQGRCPRCIERLRKVLDSGESSDSAITPIDKPAS